MPKYLFKAKLEPNYPVAEGVILFVCNTNWPDLASTKLLARELGFQHWASLERKDIQEVGYLDNLNFSLFDTKHPTVLHFENGEY